MAAAAAAMARPIVDSGERSHVVKEALRLANATLKTHDLVVRFLAQWPPIWPPSKEGENTCLDALDQRPDIQLEMQVKGEWMPIDIIYIRNMPIEPEMLKSVDVLASDICKKALAHLSALDNPKVIISKSGSKYDTTGLKEGEFSVDSDGYVRVDGLRVLFPSGRELGKVGPLKAEDSHDHGIPHFETLKDGTLRMFSDFDDIRTDGRTGYYFMRQVPISVPKDKLIASKQADADTYKTLDGTASETRYICTIRCVEDIERYLAAPSSFLENPWSYFPAK